LLAINTNIQALNVLSALNKINEREQVHHLRLVSGNRINSAKDDTAGFTIANRFRARIQGLGAATSNIGDARRLVTVAEGHLGNINEILAQMKSKVSQAASESLGSTERGAILEDLQQLNEQLDLEAAQAQRNDKSVLGVDGGVNSDIAFQIGAGTTSNDVLTFNVAESVWSSTTTTTFDSSGLDVVAYSVDTVSTPQAVGTDYDAIALSTTGSTLAGLTELTSGDYTLGISSTPGPGVNVDVEITLQDAQGDAVLISDGSTGTSTTFTQRISIPHDKLHDEILDLGVGIAIASLNGIEQESPESGTYTIAYTPGVGNRVGSNEQAQVFMQLIDDAIDNVSDALGYIGAMQNRLDYQEQSVILAKTNAEAARSRIVDADMAYEQLEITKLQIRQQSSMAMFAQANAAPSVVLDLFVPQPTLMTGSLWDSRSKGDLLLSALEKDAV